MSSPEPRTALLRAPEAAYTEAFFLVRDLSVRNGRTLCGGGCLCAARWALGLDAGPLFILRTVHADNHHHHHTHRGEGKPIGGSVERASDLLFFLSRREGTNNLRAGRLVCHLFSHVIVREVWASGRFNRSCSGG